ncbi:MAG: transcriptional regulator [Gammaproteobacteria bacterium]
MIIREFGIALYALIHFCKLNLILSPPLSKQTTNMYLPDHFKIEDLAEIDIFLKRYNFGQLITQQDGQMTATHMPFLVDLENNKLLGHFARANLHWKSVDNQTALIIFSGPHDYISPSWYQSPGVPTWNYQAVHIYGTCRIIDDDSGKSDIVNQLSQIHEAGFEKPWKPEYPESMLRGIVGLEITLTDLQAKYKLSQNRSATDQQGAIDHLNESGSTDLANAMQKHPVK